MTTTFDQTLAAAADAFLLLPGAERIIYRPRSGSARAIKAVIGRRQAEPLPGVEGGSRPRLRVLIKNDATEGIASDTVDTGGDTLDVAPEVNTRPRRMRIAEVLQHDAGLMLLAVQ